MGYDAVTLHPYFMSVTIYWMTWCHIPKDFIFKNIAVRTSYLTEWCCACKLRKSNYTAAYTCMSYKQPFPINTSSLYYYVLTCHTSSIYFLTSGFIRWYLSCVIAHRCLTKWANSKRSVTTLSYSSCKMKRHASYYGIEWSAYLCVMLHLLTALYICQSTTTYVIMHFSIPVPPSNKHAKSLTAVH